MPISSQARRSRRFGDANPAHRQQHRAGEQDDVVREAAEQRAGVEPRRKEDLALPEQEPGRDGQPDGAPQGASRNAWKHGVLIGRSGRSA